MATYYNAERFGSDEIPDIVDNNAAPEWAEIGSGGAGRGTTTAPTGWGPSLRSGSTPASRCRRRTSRWWSTASGSTSRCGPRCKPSPSSWPAIFGVLIGLQVVLLGALAGPATATLSSLLLAAAATVIGVVQFRSLPSETGPLLSWWLLPTIALVCTIFTILTYGRWALLQSALALLTGAQLALWAFTRRATLTSAVLPTDLPFWLDRMVTGAALTGGATLVVVTLLALFRPTPDF